MKTLIATIMALIIAVSPVLASRKTSIGQYQVSGEVLQFTEDPNENDPNEVPIPDEE